MNAPTIGWSLFARSNSTLSRGNSYTIKSFKDVVESVRKNWDKRKPGAGETTTDRKVLVPVPPQGFFCPLHVPLIEGMPIQSQVVTRQEGEDPYIETFVIPRHVGHYSRELVEGIPAASVDIVVYSAEALLENDGERTTNDEWEIVTIIAKEGGLTEQPMTPLAMARNMLEKPGGTKGEYTAQEFAEAIWYWSQRGVRVREMTRE